MERTILVTGGAGYIGSHVVHALCDAGAGVVVIDDLSRGDRGLLPDGVTLVEADICDAGAVDAVFAMHCPTAVMHLAARSLVPESITRPLDYYRVNVEGTRLLAAACQAYQVKAFIYSSTASVYGVPEAQPVAEDARTEPGNPYGASKLGGEWVLRDAHLAGGPACITLRYFNAAGADPGGRCGQVGPASHLIKVAAQVVVGVRDHLVIHGTDYPTPDRTCIRDYLHVSDIAAAHLDALAYLEQGGKPDCLNLGYGRGFSVREILTMVEQLYPGILVVREGDRRPGDVPELIAACDRARATIGWSPAHNDLAEIIRTAVEWERRLQ
ncbi:MAG: UDP-glucose 4-epimerase GalE [Rhodospirillales bacterium]